MAIVQRSKSTLASCWLGTTALQRRGEGQLMFPRLCNMGRMIVAGSLRLVFFGETRDGQICRYDYIMSCGRLHQVVKASREISPYSILQLTHVWL